MTTDEKKYLLMSELLPMLTQIKNRNQTLPRYGTSFNLNQEKTQAFYIACQQLGLAELHKGANRVVEAFMELMIEHANKIQLPLLQTTLLTAAPKPNLLKISNVRQTLMLKLVKGDLDNIFTAFKEPNIPQVRVDHLKKRLRKLLPKTLKDIEEIPQAAEDKDLNNKLKQAESLLG